MTNTQLTNDLEVLEKLSREATAGPWTLWAELNIRAPDPRGGTLCPLTSSGLETERRATNAAFIAAARNFLTPANIATLKALLAGGKWEPIESAPKDGSRFLAYWPYWSNEPFVAHYCGSSGGWEGERCVSPTHADAFPERQPTHWMALPAPPSTEFP